MRLSLLAVFALRLTSAIELTIGDQESEKKAASIAAKNAMSYYTGDDYGQTPGKLPETWWEGGVLFMTLIQYWHLTGDDTYNESVDRGMQHQAGENHDYEPKNASSWLGNDDQVFWGLAAMTAAECAYPDVEDGASWLSLAQAVFNRQTPRWDTQACDGGLRWQMQLYQEGYNLKNSVSNGGLFALSARLGRYTGNKTYTEWAEKIWDWTEKSPLLDPDTFAIADSTDADNGCIDKGNLQWSYNYGLYLNGATFMYNMTDGDEKWGKRIDGILNHMLPIFFPKTYGSNIMSEVTCEPYDLCDRNQKLFKGLVAMWMAFTTTLDKETTGIIMPKLQASAEAAAKQCTGGAEGTSCGLKWFESKWDGTQGIEEEISALAVFSSVLINDQDSAPLTADNGGKSKSDPNAGTGGPSNLNSGLTKEITAGDKAGASILTLLFVGGWAALTGWIVTF